MACDHESFRAQCDISRLSTDEGGPITHYTAELRVYCAECGEQFEFQGLPGGYSAYNPTVDLGRGTANLPLMPPGQKPPEGLPGFAVQVTDMEQ